jgi:hypothetical protein
MGAIFSAHWRPLSQPQFSNSSNQTYETITTFHHHPCCSRCRAQQRLVPDTIDTGCAEPSGNQPPASPGSQPSPAQSQQPALTGVPGAEPAHTAGPATAPVKLEEFGDFECPPCGMFHPILKQMQEEFGDKLQVTFREFPLVPTHQHALAAASAAEAAVCKGSSGRCII